MASITIRNLPDEAKEKLRVMAAMEGMSLEGFLRHLLIDTSCRYAPAKPNIAEVAFRLFGEDNGADLELPEREHFRQPPVFDE